MEVRMKKYIKKLLISFGVLSMLVMSGCEKKAEEPPKEAVKLVTNTIYEAPTNPYDEQILAYNELSKALSSNASDDQVATQVAVNFAYDFFTLYNKSGKDDVGGLTFIPMKSVEEFQEYATYKYYSNYDTIVKQYGSDQLPKVTMHEVNSCQAGKYTYNNATYDGFLVKLTLKYADSKVGAEAFKTTMSIQVINEQNIYRVIVVED